MALTLYQLREALNLVKKDEHTLLVGWTSKGWIERSGHGCYRTTQTFGNSRPLAHLEEEKRPEATANEKDRLEAKLIDLERQHEDAVDGSVQQEILAEKIEQLQAEIEKP